MPVQVGTVIEMKLAPPPALAPAVAARRRYLAAGGIEHAASMTVYAFLALFPLALIGVAVLGWVLHSSHQAHEQVQAQLNGLLPGIGDRVANASVTGRFSNTALGLGGAALASLGWMSATRKGLAVVAGTYVEQNHLRAAKGDLIHGLEVAAIMTVSVAATVASFQASAWVGALTDNVAAPVFAAVLTESAGLASGWLLFVAVLRRAFPAVRLARVLEVAAYSALALEVLKALMGRYLAMVAGYQAAVYGAFAGVVGLLAWLNLMARLTLIAGAALATDD